MCNFRTVYKYELKKLTGKKLLWITGLLCAVGIAICSFSGVIGTYYVDGEPVESNYEAFRKDQSYRKDLSGRAIDEALLRETVEGYRRVPANVPRYSMTEEYEMFARPYSDIFHLIRLWTGMDLSAVQNWEADEEELYWMRSIQLEERWRSIPLTEAEKEFWLGKEGQIDTPLLYRYHTGYENILNCFLTVGVLMLLFTAVCLSNLFPEEHIRRTDQLVLSSMEGKRTVYWAKVLAGVTVSTAAAVLMTLMTVVLSLGFYGPEGAGAPAQLSLSTYSYPMTMGQACLIAYGVLIVTSVLAAVFVMLLSELFRSGIVALAISTGLIILGNVVMIPTQYRVAAQVWDWSPMAYLSTWNVFDPRTLCLFGRCFPSWQAVPVLYVLLSVGLAVGGARIYRQYQVAGR